MNFTAHSQYLQQLISEYENIKNVLPVTVPTEDTVIYQVQKFVDVDQIWNDAKGILHNNQFYALGIVGTQGTGKTETATEFCKRARNDGYKIVYALPEDFLSDVELWIEKVAAKPSARYCFVLDDLSYYFNTRSNKQQSLMKNAISRFRHVFGGEIFIIYITHRLHGTPPMLRNAGSWIFTQLNSNDQEDMLEVIGRNKAQRQILEEMQSFLKQAIIEGNKNTELEYEYKNEMYKFTWGNSENYGDGRLMAALHEDQIQLFNCKLTADTFQIKDFRYPEDLISGRIDHARKMPHVDIVSVENTDDVRPLNELQADYEKLQIEYNNTPTEDIRLKMTALLEDIRKCS